MMFLNSKLRKFCVVVCLGLFGAFAGLHARDSLTIHLVGDSTMALRDHSKGNPEHGWGEMLEQHLSPGIVVNNAAACGRSAKSFRASGLWAKVAAQIQPDDWVLVQFGHNDQKKRKPKIYSDEIQYRALLNQYVNDIRALGAHPILATSIYRRVFNAEGHLVDTLGIYPEVVRVLGPELKVPVVDLHTATGAAFRLRGVEGSLSLFLHFEPGEHAYYPEGRADNSHLSKAGAELVAALFVAAVSEANVSFSSCLRLRK